MPQLADASEVFMGIKRNENVKYTALTPNEIGLDNALKVNIDEIAVFAAASESFSKKNINCDIVLSISLNGD